MIADFVKSRLQIILCLLLAAALFLILGKNVTGFSKVWKNRLASVPGGVFVMGSREGNADAQPHEVRVSGFQIGRCEVTVAEFVVYLNASGATNWPGSPQITENFGRYSARWFQSRKPVAFVGFADAEDYCRWLSEKTGETVRLPTEAEWEYAARGGIRRARYPWGWGRPEGRACYNADAARRVASFEANLLGCSIWRGMCSSGAVRRRGNRRRRAGGAGRNGIRNSCAFFTGSCFLAIIAMRM